MTQEDKSLLLMDLCARLPYGVIGLIHKANGDDYNISIVGGDIDLFSHQFISIKPYLRSMPSMTEEEKKEFKKIVYDSMNVDDISASVYVADWLYSKHLDVHGLIPKGLAVEVTEENNPYKE